MGTRTWVAAALVVLLLTPACMRAKLEREYRRPWSRWTTVGEDAAWTVETGLIEGGKVVGLMALNIVTFGAVGWLLDDEEEDDSSFEAWGPRQERAPPPAAAPASGRTVATGSRRSRPADRNQPQRRVRGERSAAR